MTGLYATKLEEIFEKSAAGEGVYHNVAIGQVSWIAFRTTHEVNVKILVTGATGLVGSRLAFALESEGHTVYRLSRRAGPQRLLGDPAVAGPWLDVIPDCDAVVHLAGENIFAKRWSTRFKMHLFESRVKSTQLIAERLAQQPLRLDGSPKVFLSASAIGCYGDRGEELLTEASGPGTGFMAELVQAWEAAANPAKSAGVRVVHPRLGIVLDPHGGALPQMMMPYRWFLGGRIGNGKQYISWIHHQDVTELLLALLGNSTYSGAINVTSPCPVTNDEFGRTLGKVLRRPHWLPVPTFALRVVLGEIANTIRGSERVLPQRATLAGYSFRFPQLPEALADVVKQPATGGVRSVQT